MAYNSSSGFSRLPEPSKPPLQRWQTMPTRSKSFSGPLSAMTAGSPLRARTMNSGVTAKTPKAEHNSKSQPSSPTSTRKTPARSKTPKASNPKTPMSGKKTPTISCRFIPGRSGLHEEYSCFMMAHKDPGDPEGDEEEDEVHERSSSPPREEYQKALLAAACNGEPPPALMSFSISTPTVGTGSFISTYTNNSALGSACLTSSVSARSHKKEKRKIPKSEEKILDAPSLLDDYYINVLDWGKNNLLAVALGPTVYLWNSQDGSVTELLEIPDDNCVTSLAWAQKRSYIAVGLNNGSIQLWDVDKKKKVRTMRGHADRVGSLHWNSHTLASGCKSGAVHLHDVRKQDHCVGIGARHTMEVCGVRWSPDGRMLASGGNDNIVCIWNPMAGMERPVQVLTGHQAAVKALAWCPCHSNLLATGGGTADKCIKFWNTSNGECRQSLDTRSPVTSLVWSRDGHEILSSHGQPNNQLTLWQYPSLTKVADLKGHRGRVLHIAVSPKRTRVASAGADETLRVWKCFEPAPPPSRHSSYLEDSMSSMMISGIY